MKKQYSHSTLFIMIALILFALCTFIGCVLLYFRGNDSATKNATLIFSYSEQSSGLSVDSSMPITDDLGKQLDYTENHGKYGYSEFSLSSNMNGIDSIQYEIYAIPVGVALELPTNYVKVYLTDGKADLPFDAYRNKMVPTYKSLKVASSDPAGKQLYSGTLKKGETKKFRLRMWLDDSYPITTEYRSFKIALYAKIKN